MSGASKSTTTAAPWKIQEKYLKGGFEKAAHLLDKGAPKYYGGKTLAGFSQPELKAQKGIMQTASSKAAQNLVSDAQSQLGKTYGMAGDMRKRAGAVDEYGESLTDYGDTATAYDLSQKDYAGMTPFQEQQMSDMLAGKVNMSKDSGLKSVTGAMRRDIMDELQGPGGMLAQIRQQQVGYQPGGGSRGDIVTGMAAKGASQKLADQASRMYADAFSKAQERRLPAGQMALQAQQAAQQLGLSGGNLRLGAGNMLSSAGQLGLSGIDRMPGVQNAMYDRFGRMQGVGAQQRAMHQEQINQAMNKYNYNQNKDMQHLQNYMANISGQYGGTTTSNPSALSSMGQLAALFQGFKSDIRVKENIVPEATHWKGFNVYTFNYIGDDIPRRGVMAQEVERTRPDAVYEIDGVKHVAYGIL
jgi:hypothetical protein